MTPRSRKYFERKRCCKLVNRAARFIFRFAKEAIKATQPLPKYPKGGYYVGAPSLVGENGAPELLMPTPSLHPIIVGKDLRSGLPVYGFPIDRKGQIIGSLQPPPDISQALDGLSNAIKENLKISHPAP